MMPAVTAKASEWNWADLDQTGPEAEARAEEETRRMREVEDAYRRGFDDGEEAGVRTARGELQVAMAAMLEALEEVRANREAWDARLKEHLVILSAAMAHRVMAQTREVDPTVFVTLAEEAIKAFPVEESVKIRLNPTDQAVLVGGEYLEQVVGDRAVRWIPDEDVVPGGCIVEGPDKIIDGRIDEALNRVVRALIDA